MNDAEFEAAIDAIAIDGEWWTVSGKAKFMKAGRVLIDHGWTSEEAIEFLAELYSAGASEFGA